MDFDKIESKEKFVLVGRPCECGCDFRRVGKHKGYITFSDGTGKWAGLFFENKKEIKEFIERLKQLIK